MDYSNDYKKSTNSKTIRDSIEVAPKIDKLRESKFSRLRGILRSCGACVLNAVNDMYVEGNFGRGRPKSDRFRFLPAI